MTLAELVRDKRKQRGLTQDELARISGISSATIRQIEQGKRVNITIVTANQLRKPLRLKRCICEIVNSNNNE